MEMARAREAVEEWHPKREDSGARPCQEHCGPIAAFHSQKQLCWTLRHLLGCQVAGLPPDVY